MRSDILEFIILSVSSLAVFAASSFTGSSPKNSLAILAKSSPLEFLISDKSSNWPEFELGAGVGARWAVGARGAYLYTY